MTTRKNFTVCEDILKKTDEKPRNDMKELHAIGVVRCDASTDEALRSGQKARIEIFAGYIPALERIGEHSHYWILCWLDKADRELLKARSYHSKDKTEPPYGVFALRSPCRPNPISLTLVRLIRAEGSTLYVDGLDVFDGTPVLDIKPYTKNEIVFSPRTPGIRPNGPEAVRRYFYRKGLAHHQEECAWLALGARMAAAAESLLGDLSADDVTLDVSGPGCLADVLQGLCNARLANPPRFSYTADANDCRCIWEKGGKAVRADMLAAMPGDYTAEQLMAMEDEDLFRVRVTGL
jgi:tRNA (adenine37-N6)-methyltransferase